MAAPKVNLGTVANVFVRQMHFEVAGDEEIGHKHPYNHMTLLAKGCLRVVVGDQTRSFVAPNMIYIAAETQHTLIAETDNTVAYCVHALREPTGDIVDESMVPKGTELFNMMARLVSSNA